MLTSPFAPKRGSRYFMLSIHLMLFLVIFMAKKESRWSWLKWFSLNATKVAIYSWFLYDEIDLEFKTGWAGQHQHHSGVGGGRPGSGALIKIANAILSFICFLVFCLQVAKMINVSSHAEIREGIAELQAAQVEICLQTFFSRCARLISWWAAQIGSFPLTGFALSETGFSGGTLSPGVKHHLLCRHRIALDPKGAL